MSSIKHLNWVTSVAIGMPVAILGFIGNIISIAIWMRFIKRRIGSSPSSAIYFVALAIVDSGLLFFFLLNYSIPSAVGHEMSHIYSFGFFYAYIGFPFFFFFIVASIWMLVGLTINRLIMVRYPVKARRYCSSERVYIAIACILAFSFVINFPHFFNYEAHYNSKGGIYFRPTKYSESGSALRYEFWVHCMVLVLVPWFSIAIMNAWIITTLMYKTKEFKDLDQDADKVTDRQKQDRQITVTLLTVTFSFLILLAWQCVNQCFFMLDVGKASDKEQWHIVEETYAFAKLGVVVNSSINCLLYCFSGSTFRKELRRLFVRDEYSTTTKRTLTPRQTDTV